MIVLEGGFDLEVVVERLATLQGAAWVFIASWVVHTSDHARRGLDASPDGVVWAGTLVGLLAAVVVTLILVGHASAPALAAVAFPAIAFGVAASHLPPDWGSLSDPILVESNTDGWSIAAVMGEVLAAAWLGLVAFRIVRRHHFSLDIAEPGWA